MPHPTHFCLSQGVKALLARCATCSALCLGALPGTAHADSWTGIDKQQHLAGSAALAVMISRATHDPTLGFWSSVGMGAAKEAADRYRRSGDPSMRDLLVNVMGAYLGAYNQGWTVHQNGGTTTVAFTWRF